jgi:hypothetical protein
LASTRSIIRLLGARLNCARRSIFVQQWSRLYGDIKGKGAGKQERIIGWTSVGSVEETDCSDKSIVVGE